MQLGLSTYSFPWAFGVPSEGYSSTMDLEDLFLVAEKYGIQRVQVGDNYPLHELTETELNRLAKQALTLGIQVEVGTRRLETDHINNYLMIAGLFYSPFLRVVIDDNGFEPTFGEILSTIRSLLPSLKEKSIVLAIENHDRFPASQLQDLITQTDENLLGICLDTANSLGANEGIDTVLDHLAPYVVNLHIKDIHIQRLPHKMGFTVEGCAAGEGILDIPQMVEALTPFQKCESATLEVWSSPLEKKENTLKQERGWVEKSLNYLSSLAVWES